MEWITRESKNLKSKSSNSIPFSRNMISPLTVSLVFTAFLSKSIIYKIKGTIFNSKFRFSSVYFVCYNITCTVYLLYISYHIQQPCASRAHLLGAATVISFSCLQKNWFFTCIIEKLVLEQTKRNTGMTSTLIPISLWLERLRNWYGAGRIRFLFVYLSIVK